MKGQIKILYKSIREGPVQNPRTSIYGVGENLTGVRLSINHSKCKKCGICTLLCPENALIRVGKKIRFLKNFCKRCEICIEECPSKAIEKREL